MYHFSNHQENESNGHGVVQLCIFSSIKVNAYFGNVSYFSL